MPSSYVRPEHIGGGTVRRMFTMGADKMVPGMELDRQQVLGMAPNNRQALIDGGYLSIFPPHSEPVAAAITDPEPVLNEMHLVSRGFGKYDVIRGRKLNDEPLSKEDGEAMIAAMQGAPPTTN